MANVESAIDFGDLPTGWSLVPVRSIVRKRRKLVGANSAAYKLLSLTLRGVIVRDLSGMKGKFPASFETYQEVEPGDLVLCMFDVEETPRTVGLSRHYGMITGAYDVYRSDDAVALEYLTRLLLVLDENKSLAPLYRGLRKTIPRTAFESLKVPMPTKEDQGSIVRYLDHAELRIAKAIAAKQELVALLNEHRRTVIDALVLRGLDPEVKSIESNSDWMGEIPAHWEVVSSKSLFAHRKERSRAGDEMLTASQSRGILRRDEFMALEGRRVMQVLVGSDILKHVEPNDFVISMRSFQGGLEWSKVRGCISSAYVMLIPGPKVHGEYFALLLKSRAYVSALRTTSDLVRDGQALRYANFCQLQLPLPPLEEQRRIAALVDEKVANLDRAIAPVIKEIALLKEYRTRLVSDVVTGKLDVRKEAAKLPEIDPIDLVNVAVGENGDDEEASDDD